MLLRLDILKKELKPFDLSMLKTMAGKESRVARTVFLPCLAYVIKLPFALIFFRINLNFFVDLGSSSCLCFGRNFYKNL